MLLGGIGLVLTILVWLFGPAATIRIAYVVPAGVISLIILAVVADAGYRAWQLRIPGLPKVLYATNSVSLATSIQLICLLEPSEMFSYGLQVGFYYQNEDGFEVLVGIGHVINIQDDKRVQVGLTRTSLGQERTVELIAQNTKSIVERVRVKPSVPHDALDDSSVRTTQNDIEQKSLSGDRSKGIIKR
jgi:hypothetical protein